MKTKSPAELDREIAEFLSVTHPAIAKASLVDTLLHRMAALEAQHVKASDELSDAGREADNVTRAEERGHAVDPARKNAAERRWAKAVRAEQSLTNQMRDVVLRIRSFDPTRVPHGWKNTR